MRRIVRVFLTATFLLFLSSAAAPGVIAALNEQTMMGSVARAGQNFVIEADDGDYIVKGKDVSKFLDKLVIVTGIVKEDSKEDFIEIKTIEDIQESMNAD